MKKKFRAFYKPDFDTKDGALLFSQKEVNYELKFYHEDDEGGIAYDFFVPFMDDDWIVQQFTGEKDVDGKEIYEGDIVELRSAHAELAQKGLGEYEIYYDRGSFRLKELEANWFVYCKNKEPIESIKIMKVIKNIYQND